MTTATATVVVNSIHVDASPELLYQSCVDVGYWPLIFPTVEKVDTTATAPDEITMDMTVANDLGRNAVRSHRVYHRSTLRIDFTMSTLPPAIAAMDGHWIVEADGTGARLEITHSVVPSDPSETAALVETLYGTTENVLGQLKGWVESERELDELYTEMRASTSKVSPEMYSVCELFFSRLGLCGLDWGDIVMVCKDLRKKNTHEDWADWHRRWSALGRHYQTRAEAAFADGRIETGRLCVGRAAAAFHFAEFFFFDEPELKDPTRARVTAVFERGREYSRTPIRPLRIPFRDLELPGYLMTPDGEGPWPTVILVNGLDSAKEVELLAFAESFLARGMAAVVFDGPGQGELAGSLPMEIQYENVVDAVLSVLAGESDVDSERIGIFGVSFGGYLAPRAAACLDTIKACVSLSGGFDHDGYEDLNIMVQKDFKHVFHIDDDVEMAELSRAKLNLREVPPLRVPLLSVHPEEDKIIPFESCLRMIEWAEGDTELLRYPGARHVAPEHFADYIPFFGDWMARHLGVLPR
ncbi:alpha/beta hydrolase family protein DUF1100 [Herbihabitans rhizosphaerae]|uniref:Alpha/beta hydrolase family protein DUF1100 n=1 Tax=Herbihabitans rhizosphaerae TaxID=1872711 RepID=A0A4Q7KEB5_9PSEU|nr:alpha/beta hydrolase [Herbihabitans rhizosphaerae]RZS31180.1 alpha/beta hydrolase family protein DUF1100 [Herbihabitans rhizosphaerae]